jgi:phenylalanyl-tRNA synthetase beta chain
VAEALSEAHLPKAAEVVLRQRRLNELMGVDVALSAVDEAFERLGFELIARDEAVETGVQWTIRSPSHRFDIAIEADLVEEICRIYGYNNVPSRRPTTDLTLSEVPLERGGVPALKRQFVDLGYQEVITYSFIDPKLQDLLAPGTVPQALANPMSQDMSVMRTNMLPGMLDALRANIARQQDRVKLFEVGQCFLPVEGGEIEQPWMIGAVLWGRRHPENWNVAHEAVDFFDLKGDVERLFSWTGRRDIAFTALEDPVLHPGQSAQILAGGTPVGRLGRLHPEIEQHLDIVGDVFLLEVLADAVLSHARRRHSVVSRYPSVRRDLAIVVPETVPAANIVQILSETLKEFLVDLRLFDVYQGKGIDSTEKSLGVGLTLQKASATLTEEEIGQHMQNAIEALANEAGARLR